MRIPCPGVHNRIPHKLEGIMVGQRWSDGYFYAASMCKAATNLGKALNRKSNEHHLQAPVLAAMIAHHPGIRIAQRIGNIVGPARLSYEKLHDLLAVRLIKARDLAEFAAFDPDPRHVARDKRRRKSPVESGILALT